MIHALRATGLTVPDTIDIQVRIISLRQLNVAAGISGSADLSFMVNVTVANLLGSLRPAVPFLQISLPYFVIGSKNWSELFWPDVEDRTIFEAFLRLDTHFDRSAPKRFNKAIGATLNSVANVIPKDHSSSGP